ncbi:MAG: PAS domain-containing protein, partial [Bacteroidota bacterium]|nr:PAS domain-containing protein [Bacteroidota bacterium]
LLLTQLGMYVPPLTFGQSGLDYLNIAFLLIMLISTVGLLTFVNMKSLRQALTQLRATMQELTNVNGQLQEENIERKRMEEILRASEDKYRTVADFTYDWEYWMGPDGNYQYISPSCERITGYAPQEFLHDPNLFLSIIHPDDRSIITAHLHNALHANNDVDSLDFCIITKEGHERWINHTCQSVYSTGGEWLGRRGSNRDITERKKAEAEREKLLSELQDALTKVKTLSGLLPICASCKKIRDEKGEWQVLEGYIHGHSEATFTHGVCPDCAKKLFGNVTTDRT